jgi:hypothetical protein
LSYNKEQRLIQTLIKLLRKDALDWYLVLLPNMEDPDAIDGILIGNLEAVNDYTHDGCEVYDVNDLHSGDLN